MKAIVRERQKGRNALLKEGYLYLPPQAASLRREPKESGKIATSVVKVWFSPVHKVFYLNPELDFGSGSTPLPKL